MFMHNLPTAEIWRDNCLSQPYFKNPDNSLKTFDFIVAGVPFSTKDWSNGLDPVNDLFDHFVYASMLTMLFSYIWVRNTIPIS